MATHSSIPGWRTPWTEEPGGLTVAKRQTQLKRLSMHAQPKDSFLFTSEPTLRSNLALYAQEVPNRC